MHVSPAYDSRASTRPADVAEARIESLNYDGRGVGRVNGKVVFIDGALPGETVRFRYLSRHRNYDSGAVLEILVSSPDRVTPPCPHYGVCGGCSLQHLRPAAQIGAKQQVLTEQLMRIGKVAPETWLPPLTGPVWGYRRRARLGVRLLSEPGGVVIGFRERRKSHIANLDACPVLEPKISSLLPAVRALIAGLSCPDRIPQLEIAAGDNATALVFRHLVPLTEADRAQLRGFGARHDLQIQLQGDGPESLLPLWPEQAEPLHYDLPEYDVSLRFRPTDFIQANGALNQRLVHQALELLDLKAGDRVLDLFCGLGNFSLPLARRTRQVLGIEAGAELVAGARRNAERNGLANAEFRQADLYATESAAAPWGDFAFNKLLLDPPRDGAMEVIKRLPAPGAERIVYVSCYPATLARDAQHLVRVHGYRFAAAGVSDMFPHTSHVESMALFVRP
jgi:23S rRNA (uracil1939-C5)-methyltransferase